MAARPILLNFIQVLLGMRKRVLLPTHTERTRELPVPVVRADDRISAKGKAHAVRIGQLPGNATAAP